jgi:hypothetical protein
MYGWEMLSFNMKDGFLGTQRTPASCWPHGNAYGMQQGDQGTVTATRAYSNHPVAPLIASMACAPDQYAREQAMRAVRGRRHAGMAPHLAMTSLARTCCCARAMSALVQRPSFVGTRRGC